MLHWELSLLPLVTVAVVNFFLSWIYYSPAVPWFKAWAKGVGMDLGKTEMTEEDKKKMPFLMGGAVLSSFLVAGGLQVLIHSLGSADFVSGALVGVLAWVTFAVTHSLNTLFEGRKPSVLVINNVLYLVTYAGFGGLLAVWK